jgi:hypothetical protein
MEATGANGEDRPMETIEAVHFGRGKSQSLPGGFCRLWLYHKVKLKLCVARVVVEE